MKNMVVRTGTNTGKEAHRGRSSFYKTNFLYCMINL